MTRIAITIARLLLCAFCFALPMKAETALDQPGQKIEQQAQALFRDMPEVVRVADVLAHCGAGSGVSVIGAYCTTENVIYMRDVRPEPKIWAHHLAHLYGHAVQVQHGVADIAFRQIRLRPTEEAKLRGWVTRQVECIAGYIYSETELPELSLQQVYATEPLTGSHWGRDPLSVGPKVSIGLEARAEWFERGRTQGLGSCAPGEFSADLLLKARR